MLPEATQIEVCHFKRHLTKSLEMKTQHRYLIVALPGIGKKSSWSVVVQNNSSYGRFSFIIYFKYRFWLLKNENLHKSLLKYLASPRAPSFQKNPYRWSKNEIPVSSTTIIEFCLYIIILIFEKTKLYTQSTSIYHKPRTKNLSNHISSMYGIFTYIYHKNQPNVGKYAIHGWYG